MSLLIGLVKFQQLICVSANIQNWRVRKKSGQFGWILIPVVLTGSLPVCFKESLYNYEERGSLAAWSAPAVITRDYPEYRHSVITE